LSRLRTLLARGLAATAALWPDIQTAYAWVHQAAHLLANEAGRSAADVRQAYTALLAAMRTHRETAGALAPAVDHFLKVTASYWTGLFQCYAVPDLPRTNNDLEHFFGVARYQERRATGRKGAAPGTVVRGSVRLVAAVATRQRRFSGPDLRPPDPAQWDALRRTLTYRHEARRAQLRFRRDPTTYLATLEDQLLQTTLPP
jgi:hypothetical protein